MDGWSVVGSVEKGVAMAYQHELCLMPGCDCLPSFPGAHWCDSCFYPGIDGDLERYRSLRNEGFGVFQAMVMVGWADPN